MQQRDEPADLASALHSALALDGSLNERLASYADALRRLNRPFAEAVDRLVERLARSGAGATAPEVGEAMPDFLLPDASGHLTNLDDVLEAGPVAIIFHRGHWCPYCHITNQALVRLGADAGAIRRRIVVITPDRQQFVSLLPAVNRAAFPVLTDIDNGYALSLGLAIWVGDEVRGVMQSIGRDLGAYQGNDSWFLPIPATFVVGPDKRIVARHVDPDYRRRMEIEDLLAALRAAA